MQAEMPNGYLPPPFQGLTDAQLLERWPHAFRFRDPSFVEIWSRWQEARRSWRKAWWGCPTGTPPSFKDEDCPDHPVAREFVAARRAYLNDLARRKSAEDRENPPDDPCFR